MNTGARARFSARDRIRRDDALDVLNQIPGKDIHIVSIGGVARIAARGDEVAGVRAYVAETGDEAGRDLAIDGDVEVEGERTLQV